MSNSNITKHSFKRSFKLLVILMAGLVIFAAACGSDDDDESNVELGQGASAGAEGTTTTQAAASNTYDAPGALVVQLPVPDVAPGTILDTERLTLSGGHVGYRFLYASRSVQEEPIAVSGVIITPPGEAPEGGWPLVAWAHGTTGMADICAPSLTVEEDASLWGLITDAGYAVVATDHEGLGTPGLHPYIVGDSEARGVFDSVRAVQNHGGELAGIEVSDGWVAWGHSQGGHSTMHVAQRWEDYAPELNLLGVVAGAPPSQFNLLYGALLGGPFQGYIAMTFAAVAESYPQVILEDYLGDTALELLPILDEGCLDEIFEAFNPLTPEELSKLPNPLNVEPMKSVVDDNDPRNRRIQAPLLIIHGMEDEQIVFASSLFLTMQLCALDDSVPLHHMAYEGETHTSVIAASADDMFEWIGARFDGEPAQNDCMPEASGAVGNTDADDHDNEDGHHDEDEEKENDDHKDG